MIEKIKIHDILTRFPVFKKLADFEILNAGLINETYRVEDTIGKKFLLQRINTSIFNDVDSLMYNIKTVSSHIEKKLKKNKCNTVYQNVKYYPDKDGNMYIKETDNSLWRLSDYIEHVDSSINPQEQLASETGRILAVFHLLTSDIGHDKLKITIPDFHNLIARHEQLKKIIDKKPARLEKSMEIYEELREYEYLAEEFKNVISSDKLQYRTVHYDPKVSNILFDENGKAMCLIDLDTLMPGYVNVDFGDAVRSLCNKADENEKDYHKAGFDIEKYNIFKDSYLEVAGDFLSETEIALLPIFAMFITYEQAIRFFADYLEGDKYYKIDYPEQNLNRAYVQMALVKDMKKKLFS